MKITKVDLFPKTFQLKSPSAVAYASVDTAPHLFVRIGTESGLEGWGCCAPDPVVTGETVEKILAFMESKGRSLLLERNALQIQALDAQMVRHGEDLPGARAAVNIALYDLLGKLCGRPVYQLLGFYRQCIPTSMTVSLASADEMAEKAREFQAQGFAVLKIKIGTSLDEDIDRVQKIRTAVGTELPLRLDANQAYSVQDALKLVESLKHDGYIEFLEQPTPAANLAGLREVTQASPIPIMADESIVSTADALSILQNHAAKVVNIKLMKAGGISAGLAINQIAHAASIPAMIGCMDESVLSIAAGLHLALACENIWFADLDGHFDIEQDAGSGGVRCEEGILYPSDEPGFGVTIDPSQL